jgi:tRNA threonylcarbamoyladenosine biosynthesis protein TsaE
MKQVRARSSDETREIARQFACSLKRGDTVALKGVLGAGKTEFARGITDVFNCSAQLASPTFTILNIYHGSLNSEALDIYHFDWYRLQSAAELHNIGFEEYLYGNGFSLIEWADKFPNLLPKTAKRVEIIHSSQTERLIIFESPFSSL